MFNGKNKIKEKSTTKKILKIALWVSGVVGIVFITLVFVWNYFLYLHNTGGRTDLQKLGHSKIHPDISIYIDNRIVNKLLDKYGKEIGVPKIDTTDWQVYEEKERDFSFKYPEGFIVKVKYPDNSIVQEWVIVDKSKKNDSCNYNDYNHEIHISEKDYPKYINALLPDILRDEIVELKYVLIDSVKFIFPGKYGDGAFSYDVIVPRKNKIIRILGGGEIDSDIFYGVLQTIHFGEKFDKTATINRDISWFSFFEFLRKQYLFILTKWHLLFFGGGIE